MTTDVAVSHSLRLEDQMCFALYAASRAVTGVYRPLLDELGLTYPQYLVMLVLWGQGSCSVKDLGAALHLDYGTLTPLLKRLEAAGYLSRRRRATDERTVDLVLTEAGAALRDRARPIPPAISQAMALTADETATLRALLRKLTTSVTTPS
ncbi:MarR family transcriptional regulator [Actinomycetes bacterium KLBMP 9797]